MNFCCRVANKGTDMCTQGPQNTYFAAARFRQMLWPGLLTDVIDMHPKIPAMLALIRQCLDRCPFEIIEMVPGMCIPSFGRRRKRKAGEHTSLSKVE